MLIKRETLEGIARGEVTCVFRRWARPRVRPGSTQRTAVGVLVVDGVTEVDPDDLTDSDACAAGLLSRNELLQDLRGDAKDPLYRVDLHVGGADPRVALRNQDSLKDTEVTELRARLDRFDRFSRQGPWTRQALAVICEHPGTRAAELAASLGFETVWFKRNVRKLKELGLTESLETGYRLSPRGRALAAALGIGTSGNGT